MKKFYTVLVGLWIAACTAIPSPDSPLQTSSATLEVTQVTPVLSMTPWITLTPSFTPSPYVTLPPQLQPTLIIPTLQAGSSAKLLSIQMIDAQTGWAIQEESREILRPGSRTEYPWPLEGYILRTVDGGKTWQNASPPTGAYSPGGFFALDANTAWASDNHSGSINGMTSSLWRTSDGGRTWQPGQPFLIAETGSEFYWPARMQFIDQNTGWLLASIEVGMNGYTLREVLFRTTDGGDTWEKVNDFLKDLGTCGNGGLAFIDSTTGWYGQSCVGDGKTSRFFNIHFAGGKYNIRHTTDGGDSFSFEAMISIPPEIQKLEATSPEMNCGERRVVAFTPEVLGIAWECQLFWQPDQYYRYFSFSTDAGRTWNTWEPTGNEYFLNATHGWRLLSPGQLQQTTDGGLNWLTIKTVAWQDAQFDFISEQEGWALVRNADATAFVHTTDGGKTWEEIKPVIVP